MKNIHSKNILVAGEGKMTTGIVTNLLKSGACVYFMSGDLRLDQEYIKEYIASLKEYQDTRLGTGKLQYIEEARRDMLIDLAICCTIEDLPYKQQLISRLAETLSHETMIAVNTDSFLLEELQQGAMYPGRIIGLNWCDPAHVTSFLEIIANDRTSSWIVEQIETMAKNDWQKDPYTVYCGYSVRARLMASLAREAFYLVENGYASIEDIDRACRNDAGYYLPFAGNCRYMDLMGTYAYGLVMKDLNRELSKAQTLPSFFTRLVEMKKTGMENSAGFYNYAAGEASDWEKTFCQFSFEVKDIIDKYPFNHVKQESGITNSKITQDE